MVGDNLDADADVAGARAAGIRSVWVRNPDEWLTFTSGAVPDHEAPEVAAAIRLVLASCAVGRASSAGVGGRAGSASDRVET